MAVLKFGSVCSGIEAASVAWLPLGMTCSFMSEIDGFPRAVLQHHYGDTPLHDNFTTIKKRQYEPIDLLVGGTPCQSFSVAGLRGGTADERGNLALEYLRLAERLRPKWLVWENVPGVLSSEGGRDFGSFIGGMAELGYGWAYRVLDAQHFGLAQRRKRVFVVGYLGDWRRAAAVLFEPASLRGDSPPSRKAREDFTHDLASSIGASGRGFERAGETRGQDPVVAVAFGGNNQSGPIDVATAVNAHGGPHGRQDFESETFVTHALRADGFDASEDGTGRGTPLVAFPANLSGTQYAATEDLAPSMGAKNPTAVAFQDRFRGDDGRGYDRPPPVTEDMVRALETVKPWNVAAQSAVRRLTPGECEILMGFPPGYTLIPYRGGMAADGNRYKSLGNSMAVPIMAWLGRRIMECT